jgi:hypothetical protein
VTVPGLHLDAAGLGNGSHLRARTRDPTSASQIHAIA